MRPTLPPPERVVPYLDRMHKARLYSNFGPLVRELEARLAERLGVDAQQVVVCANATLALQGACQISEGASVAVPSYTFPASAMAVVHAGSELVLHDINPATWKLEIPKAARRADQVLMPVMPFGAPVDLQTYESHREVIVDAAASIGVPTDLGALPSSWVVVYSLHATKVLGVGEGGFAVFGDVSRATEFRTWTNFGFSGTRESRMIGTNAKMSEIGAAYAHAVLDDWEIEQQEWESARARAATVDEVLGIQSIAREYPGVSPYWIAQFDSAVTRASVEQSLTENGIGSRRWWSWGCHKMAAFEDFLHGDYPVTDAVAGSTLGLPISRGSTQAEFDEIESVIGLCLRDNFAATTTQV